MLIIVMSNYFKGLLAYEGIFVCFGKDERSAFK